MLGLRLRLRIATRLVRGNYHGEMFGLNVPVRSFEAHRQSAADSSPHFGASPAASRSCRKRGPARRVASRVDRCLTSHFNLTRPSQQAHATGVATLLPWESASARRASFPHSRGLSKHNLIKIGGPTASSSHFRRYRIESVSTNGPALMYLHTRWATKNERGDYDVQI